MNDCRTCGLPIRLRAMRVSFNRRRGTAHWLEAVGNKNCPCIKNWVWTKWRADKQRPTVTDQAIAKWNVQNPLAETGENYPRCKGTGKEQS